MRQRVLLPNLKRWGFVAALDSFLVGETQIYGRRG
jgi:hypothetical protein